MKIPEHKQGKYIANDIIFNSLEEMNKYILSKPDLYKVPWITYEQFYEMITKEDSKNEND